MSGCLETEARCRARLAKPVSVPGARRLCRWWDAVVVAALLVLTACANGPGPGAEAQIDKDAGGCALCYPASQGDLAQVAFLIERGANVNATDKGMTPLYYAIDHRHFDVALLLLQRHADPNIVDEHGQTALMLATGGGDAALVEALVDAGATVNAQDDSGDSALLDAIWVSSTENFVQNFTPQNVAIIQLLLAAHADPNVKDKKGWSPLKVIYARSTGAVAGNLLPTIKLLLSAGADPKDRQLMFFALTSADLSKGSDAVFSLLLLAYGADMSGVNDPLPLDTIAARHDANTAALFVDGGANVDQEDPHGNTALNLAVGRDDLAHAQTLLELGADPMHRDSQGQFPLQSAVKHGSASMVRLLLRFGADVVPLFAADQRKISEAEIADPVIRQLLENALTAHYDGFDVADPVFRKLAPPAAGKNDPGLGARIAQLGVGDEDFQRLVKIAAEAPGDRMIEAWVLLLSRGVKSLPPAPADALKLEAEAKAQYDAARNRKAILVAAQTYERALDSAPWVAAYYRNLCTLYQVGGAYGLARQRCAAYLASSPPDAETQKRMDEINQKLSGLRAPPMPAASGSEAPPPVPSQ